MGLDSLKREIEREAEAEGRKILDDAERESRETVKGAEKGAKLKETDAEAEAQKLLASEKSERIVATRLEAKKIRADAKEEAIKESLGSVWKQFAALPKGKEYPALLGRLVSDGTREIGAGAKVYVRKEDRGLLKDMGADLAEKPIGCAGGAIIESADGKVRVDNTLEQLFEEKREEIRKEIYGRLFGQE
jgi:V/A-type H+-transporting ATPase subunit E